VLFIVTGGDDLTLADVNEAAQIITESIDRDAKVIFGTVVDDKLKKGELKVTVVATGFEGTTSEAQPALVESGSFFSRMGKKETQDSTVEASSLSEEEAYDDQFGEIPAFIRRRLK
jgi:cell division protein FtsZ